MAKPFLVAVTGGSGSGKTTFVEKLRSHLSNMDPLIFQLDHYYRDLSSLSPRERDLVNFDDPAAIEMDLCLAHLQALQEGRAIERPIYDFPTHTRKKETVALKPSTVIIVDGLFTLCDPRLVQIYDLKLYIDTDEDTRLSRRLKRDMENRGRTLSGTLDQYFKTVKPMHKKYIEPCRLAADFVIPWFDYNWSAVRHVADLINGHLARETLV